MPPTHCLYQLVSVSYHDVSCKCAFHPQIQQTSSSVNVERCYPEDGMLSSSLHFFCLELMWRILRSHPTSKFEPTSNNCYVFNAEEFPNLLTKMVLNSQNQSRGFGLYQHQLKIDSSLMLKWYINSVDIDIILFWCFIYWFHFPYTRWMIQIRLLRLCCLTFKLLVLLCILILLLSYHCTIK